MKAFVSALLCVLMLPCFAKAGMYLDLKGGGAYLPNEDLNAFSQAPQPFTGPTIGGDFYLIGGGSVGYRFNSSFSLEASSEINQTRNIENDYYNGGTKVLHLSVTDYAYSFYLAPAYSFPFYGERASVGLKIGRSAYISHIRGQNFVTAQSGSYDDVGSTTMLGIYVRHERSLNSYFNIGGEFGYNYIHFPTVTAENGNGAFSNAHGTEGDANGEAAAFDFSGPYVQLVLEYSLR